MPNFPSFACDRNFIIKARLFSFEKHHREEEKTTMLPILVESSCSITVTDFEEKVDMVDPTSKKPNAKIEGSGGASLKGYMKNYAFC